MSATIDTTIKSLKKISSGKVRDLYEIDAQRMLMVATDRLSAFDVVMTQAIPGKGKVLTALSVFWFSKLAHLVKNHLTGEDPCDFIASDERDHIAGRALVVYRLTPLPIEAIVRGYLAGSAWQDYLARGSICGIPLAQGLREAEKLGCPLFTASSKAAPGAHDENIPFSQCQRLLGSALAGQVRDTALTLYRVASHYAETRGVIIADTKFEFGLDNKGELYLIDEVLTPDSSRFWPKDHYRVGACPPSFDKQFVRDWLAASAWNKQPPAPSLPDAIIQKTAAQYQEAFERLTQ